LRNQEGGAAAHSPEATADQDDESPFAVVGPAPVEVSCTAAQATTKAARAAIDCAEGTTRDKITVEDTRIKATTVARRVTADARAQHAIAIACG
jgi:hypothetical protein